MSEQCQLCGGPVENGRCKLCGMPCRSDEILYHLNENRRDHYEHAPNKVKRILRAMEVPAGDRKKYEHSSRDAGGTETAGKRGQTSTDAGGPGAAGERGQTSTDAGGTGAAGKTGQSSAYAGGTGTGGKRVTTFSDFGSSGTAEKSRQGDKKTGAPGGRTAPHGKEKNTWLEKERRKSKKSDMTGTRERRRGRTWLFILVAVLILLILGAISQEEKTVDKPAFGKNQGIFYRDFNEEDYVGYLSSGQILIVGEEIAEGKYLLRYEEEGTAYIRIEEQKGWGSYQFETITLNRDTPWTVEELRDGQKVSFSSEGGQESRLEFYLVS